MGRNSARGGRRLPTLARVTRCGNVTYFPCPDTPRSGEAPHVAPGLGDEDTDPHHPGSGGSAGERMDARRGVLRGLVVRRAGGGARGSVPPGERAGDPDSPPGRERPVPAVHHPGLRRGHARAVSAPWLLLAVLLPAAGFAEPRTYRVAPPSEGSKAEAVVVYSLGSHTQTAQEIRGEVTLDPATLSGGSGAVVVPISGIRGDGSTRDCHMREALGVDYAAGGRFPGEHVCDGQNRLPASGPESVTFPDVRLELLGARPLDDLSLLAAGQPVRVEVDARWTVHGAV